MKGGSFNLLALNELLVIMHNFSFSTSSSSYASSGITTARLRTLRLRQFVYRHFVCRYFVYYDFPCWNRSWSDETHTESI